MQTKIGRRPCIPVKDFQNESKCTVGGFCSGNKISQKFHKFHKKKFKVVMQYFFFEKYLMAPDSFVYINAILMLISSALFIKDLGPFYISF